MNALTQQYIQSKILRLPSRPDFMLDFDVAELYETKTKQVNQAVKRNPGRFPQPEFCFQLTEEEWNVLRSHFVTASWGGTRKPPMAFPRMGANQLSSVLKTPVAAQRSVQIARAFSTIEEAHAKGAGNTEELLKDLFGQPFGAATETAAPPTIRRTGGYSQKQTVPQFIALSNASLKLIDRLKQETASDIRQMLYQQLHNICQQLRCNTPPLEAIGREASPVPDERASQG